jgi:hypothetical protein
MKAIAFGLAAAWALLRPQPPDRGTIVTANMTAGQHLDRGHGHRHHARDDSDW